MHMTYFIVAEVGAYSVNAINLFVADAIDISLVYCSVAEPEPEPKLNF